MLPAHQTLRPMHPSPVHVHDRLVEHDDLVRVERAPELAQHAQPAYRVPVERGGVHLAAGVRLLGRVHSHVRAAQQRVRILPVTREARHTDAHPHLQRHLVDHHRLLDTLDQPLGNRLELRRVTRRLRRQHRELVAAQARHQTLRSDCLRQARAKVAQQLIAEVVAKRVVDLLEAIEVEQHHRELLVRAVRRRDPPVQVRAEPLAVGQAGQLVGRSAAVELLAALLRFEELANEVLEDDQRKEAKRRSQLVPATTAT